ncbi:hypothetical protein [Idiomarina sp.]|uniref:hypothetical protein n=1 Tax=Idiomarina sp. TaxID=1874361 RepID=UPI003A8CE2D3
MEKLSQCLALLAYATTLPLKFANFLLKKLDILQPIVRRVQIVVFSMLHKPIAGALIRLPSIFFLTELLVSSTHFF